MDIEFDPPLRACLGCIQIPTDFTLDNEGPAMLSKIPNVEMRLQKLKFDSETLNQDTYMKAKDNIKEAVQVLLPHNRVTVFGLSCTSMSYTLGPDLIDAQLKSFNPDVKTTDMARSQVLALKTLGARKIGLVVPYVKELAEANANVLTSSAGVEVVKMTSMNLDRDTLTSQVSKASIAKWAKSIDCPEIDTIVIGCSGFRACEPGFIDNLETDLGKPVVTSTQAFLWNMLRLGGIEDKITGYGVLLSKH